MSHLKFKEIYSIRWHCSIQKSHVSSQIFQMLPSNESTSTPLTPLSPMLAFGNMSFIPQLVSGSINNMHKQADSASNRARPMDFSVTSTWGIHVTPDPMKPHNKSHHICLCVSSTDMFSCYLL